MGSLVIAAQAAYNGWKDTQPSTISDWNNLSSSDVTTMFINEQKYLLAIEDAQLIESSFYDARTQAFQDFETTKQLELTALQVLWQAKEDNFYDTEYVPGV